MSKGAGVAPVAPYFFTVFIISTAHPYLFFVKKNNVKISQIEILAKHFWCVRQQMHCKIKNIEENGGY